MLKTKVSLIERHELSFIVDTDDEGVADAAIDKWLERSFGSYEDGDQDAFEKVDAVDRFSTVLHKSGYNLCAVEDYRKRFYDRLIHQGADATMAEVTSDGAEFDPDTTPEDAADDEMANWGE